MPDILSLNTRRVDIPIDTAALNKVIRDLNWDAVRSSGPMTRCLCDTSIDMGSKRVKATLRAQLTCAPSPVNASQTRDPHIVVGMSDDIGPIKAVADKLRCAATIGMRARISFTRRNARYQYHPAGSCVVLDNGCMVFTEPTDLPEGTPNVDRFLRGRADCDLNIEMMLHKPIVISGPGDTRVPAYYGILTSNSLNPDNACGGNITRIGAAYDKLFDSATTPMDAHRLLHRNSVYPGGNVSYPALIAHGWRMLQCRPSIIAAERRRYRVASYNKVSLRYFDALIGRSDDKDYNMYSAFNSLSRRPATHIHVQLDFFVMAPESGSHVVSEVPADTNLTVLLDNTQISCYIQNAIHKHVNSYWDMLGTALKPMDITSLAPSTLFCTIADATVRNKLMASPFGKAIVRKVYGGWCYSDHTAADAEFKAHPPTSMRGVNIATPRQVQEFETAKHIINDMSSAL